eukprot:655487-Heterocapsa_arctica.AAC.1
MEVELDNEDEHIFELPQQYKVYGQHHRERLHHCRTRHIQRAHDRHIIVNSGEHTRNGGHICGTWLRRARRCTRQSSCWKKD